MDVAYGNGYYVVVSLETDSGGAYNYPLVRIIDGTTRALAKSYQLVASATYSLVDVKAAVVGTDLVVVYATTTHVYAARLDLTALETGLGSEVELASDYAGSCLALHVISSMMVLGYQNSGGSTTRISLKSFDPSTALLAVDTSTTQTTLDATLSTLALGGLEELWVAWGHTSAVTLRASARDASALTPITTIHNVLALDTSAPVLAVIGRVAAHQVYVAASSGVTAYSTWKNTQTARLVNTSGTLTIDRERFYVQGWVPLSQPFVVGGRVYMELAYDDMVGDIRDVVLADITSADSHPVTLRPVGWVAPRANMANVAAACSRHIATEDGVSVWVSAHLIRRSSVTTALCLARYDFASAAKHMPLVYNETLYLTGGVPYQFDGERVFEVGYIVPPRIQGTVGDPSGPGITGTVSYTAIYEYTDANGNVIWSAPAPVYSSGAITAKRVTLTLRPAVMTWKGGTDSNPDLEPQGARWTRTKVFRTLSTGTGDFYLLIDYQFSPGTLITIFDETADVSLVGNARLYKSPGILGTAKDRQTFGACRHLTECNGVLVALAEDGITLRAFAQRVIGESPWHHDTLQLPIDGDGEAIAIASLDGSIVAFKRDSVFVVPIEPANDNMSAGGFGFPRRIAVDAGCVDARSVVVTGMGIFFQSERGIELLTRSLTVEFIGQQIQDTFADYPNVAAAVLDVRNNVVRFSLAQTGSSTVGLDAIYDVTIKAWVSFDRKYGAAGAAQAASAAYVYHNGASRYAWLDSAGTVRYEDFTTGLDGGQWVSAKWETPWLKTELQREHQVWQGVALYDRQSACGLIAEVASDWADYDSGDDKTWAEAAITTYTRQVELRATGRYQSLKYRFHDTEPAVLGTGRGLSFVGLSLDLAPHQGPTQGTPRLAVASRR